MELTFKGETNVGKVRTNNEDTFVAQWIWDDWHVLAVAIDGVGGYEGGEVAAELARKTLIEYFDSHPQDKCLEQLKQAVVAANNAIMEEKQRSPQLSQMGCVLTAGLFELDRMCLNMVHVGDSRLYVYADGEIKKLSHDHSLVGYREELGELTEEEAMRHPQRNLVERMMGERWHEADDEHFLEASIFPIPQNAQYVFCSDGLTDMITSKTIMAELERPLSIEERTHQLILRALDAGGKDNVTVVLVEVVGKASPLPTSPKGEEEGLTPAQQAQQTHQAHQTQSDDEVYTPLPAGFQSPDDGGTEGGVKTIEGKGVGLHWKVGAMVLLLLVLGFCGGYFFADWQAQQEIVQLEQDIQQRDTLIKQLRKALQEQNQDSPLPTSPDSQTPNGVTTPLSTREGQGGESENNDKAHE